MIKKNIIIYQHIDFVLKTVFQARSTIILLQVLGKRFAQYLLSPSYFIRFSCKVKNTKLKIKIWM